MKKNKIKIKKSGRARGPDRRLSRNFRAAKLRCSAAEPWIVADYYYYYYYYYEEDVKCFGLSLEETQVENRWRVGNQLCVM